MWVAEFIRIEWNTRGIDGGAEYLISYGDHDTRGGVDLDKCDAWGIHLSVQAIHVVAQLPEG